LLGQGRGSGRPDRDTLDDRIDSLALKNCSGVFDNNGWRDTGGSGYHHHQNFSRSPAHGQTGVNSAPYHWER
jgi:hypothetical protein